jgi:predicted GNAT family acetyltransferase
MAPIEVAPASMPLACSHPRAGHRDALAALMLDAYRNTIDDEGESLGDAYRAIDHYFASMLRPHSFVAFDDTEPIAFAFVLIVNDVHYIDPVVVASTWKRQGLGTAVVGRCLRSLAAAGVGEVGATITDGNVASERLFGRLGFRRRGPWV